MNRKARDLVNGGEVMRLFPGASANQERVGLVGRLSSFEGEFQRRLEDAMQPVAPDTQHFSEALLLPTTMGIPGYVVHIAPLANSASFGPGAASTKAIVFIYDLRTAARVPARRLVELYGLTAAEAQAAVQLPAGGSIEEIASRLSVRANTLKSQLKAVYTKTGTCRQADLLKLLLALASA